MLTSALEHLLNRGLPRSPRARELVAQLAGQRCEVEVTGVGRFVLTTDGVALRLIRIVAPAGEGAQSSQTATQAPDHAPGHTPDPGSAQGAGRAWARISGGPFSLMSLMVGEDRGAIQNGGVTLVGDSGVARKYQELLERLRPDLEEELALRIGDGPAHQLGRLARAALGFGRRTAQTTARNAAEYLAHESRDLVSPPEGRQFLGGVDTLREDVDRLAARVDLISRRLP